MSVIGCKITIKYLFLHYFTLLFLTFYVFLRPLEFALNPILVYFCNRINRERIRL